MILLILILIMILIYNISGIIEVLSLLIWSINLFIATILLIRNPQNFFLRFVQGVSMLYILFIIFQTIKQIIEYFI